MYENRANQKSKGFTLIELLVVIAIIAILAAILFPVFAQAKVAAKKATEISNFKQVGTATAMYTADYDDGYMLSNSGSINGPGWGFGPPDSVPAQQMYAYVKNTAINVSPMDSWSESMRINDQLQYMGNPAVPSAEQRMYALGVRSNIGYNYEFFSPWRVVPVTGGQYVGAASTNGSQVGSPAATIMWGTSIWDRSGGAPTGGGNWVIETPCWRDPNTNKLLDPMKQYGPAPDGDNTLRAYQGGWDPTGSTWLVYGGLWPFYNQTSLNNISPGLKDGHVVVGFADSHVKSMPIRAITAGCAAYGTGQFLGKVTDLDKFLWDFN